MALTWLGMVRRFTFTATYVCLLVIGCGGEVSPTPIVSDSDAGCFANAPNSGFDGIEIGNGDVAAPMWTPYDSTPDPKDDAPNAGVSGATAEVDPASTSTHSNREH